VLSVSAGGNAGHLLRPEILTSMSRTSSVRGTATAYRSLLGKIGTTTAKSLNLCVRGNPKRENREILTVPRRGLDRVHGRSANYSDGTAEMNIDGKSDDFIALATRANKTATAAAESAEGSEPPKRSISELSPMFRTLSRIQHQLAWHGNHNWCNRVVAAIVRPNGGAV